jgi:hypothetical protein
MDSVPAEHEEALEPVEPLTKPIGQRGPDRDPGRLAGLIRRTCTTAVDGNPITAQKRPSLMRGSWMTPAHPRSPLTETIKLTSGTNHVGGSRLSGPTTSPRIALSWSFGGIVGDGMRPVPGRKARPRGQ